MIWRLCQHQINKPMQDNVVLAALIMYCTITRLEVQSLCLHEARDNVCRVQEAVQFPMSGYTRSIQFSNQDFDLCDNITGPLTYIVGRTLSERTLGGA